MVMQYRQYNSPIKYQQGVVLVVSLVFLIALTAVAAALMQNSTSDMKMSGASEEKVVAEQEAISAVDEVIYLQLNGATNLFIQSLVNYKNNNTYGVVSSDLVTTKDANTTAEISVENNPYFLEADCPHSRSASSVQIFSCNYLTIQVKKKYGRKQTSEVDANAGIAQELLR